MGWQSVTMRTDFSDAEVASFLREITAAHGREVAAGARNEYRLYRRKMASGDHTILIPPEVAHLAEQTPTWGKQLKQIPAPQNLTGFSEVNLR